MRIHQIILLTFVAFLMPACFATQYGSPAIVNLINEGGVGRSGTAQSPEMQDDGCGNLNQTHEGTLGDAWRRVGKMHEDTWSGRSSIYIHLIRKSQTCI